MVDRYSGRRPTCKVVNFSIDKEALAVLDRAAPSPKSKGRFIARLLYEFEARADERRKVEAEKAVYDVAN